MLSAAAGALVTVPGVTFSITVVAVPQASSQYTPRILRNFMRDRPSELTLGTLTGVFVSCLVVIRTICGADELTFVPALAVLAAFLLGIAAIGVLIFFIHHIAGALQASEILARVEADTVGAVDRLFPDDDVLRGARRGEHGRRGRGAGVGGHADGGGPRAARAARCRGTTDERRARIDA